MKKYILSYDHENGMDTRFFQTDKNLEELGFEIGASMWGDFVDEDLSQVLNDLFGIDFVAGETVMIEEIPEEFETI